MTGDTDVHTQNCIAGGGGMNYCDNAKEEEQHRMASVPLVLRLAGAASGGCHHAGHQMTCMICLQAGHCKSSCSNTCQWIIPATKNADAHVCGAAGATGANVTAVGLATHNPSCGWAKRHKSVGNLNCSKPALSKAAKKEPNHWKNVNKRQKCE